MKRLMLIALMALTGCSSLSNEAELESRGCLCSAQNCDNVTSASGKLAIEEAAKIKISHLGWLDPPAKPQAPAPAPSKRRR